METARLNGTTPTTITTAPVGAIVIGRRYRQDLGNIAELAKSIGAVGLLQPIVVTRDLRLLAGYRRLVAVKELHWADVPVRVVDTLDDAVIALRAEHDENILRKAFTPSEKVAIGRALEELEKAEAKKRQKAGGQAGGKGSGNLPETSKGQTRDKVAKAVGYSGRTYDKVKEVVAAGEQQPEEFAEVVAEMDRTGRVDPAFQKVRAKKAANKQAKVAATKQAKEATRQKGTKTAAAKSPSPSISPKQATKIKQFLSELSFDERDYLFQEVINTPTCLNLSTNAQDMILLHVRTTQPELAPLVRGVLESQTGPDVERVVALWRAVAFLNPASRPELLAALREQAKREG